MRRVGAGAKEIRQWDATGTFRIIDVAALGKRVHVLHCFQKKTQKTSQADINLADSFIKPFSGRYRHE